MRVWALASCGSLIALAACSTNKSAPPQIDAAAPEGDKNAPTATRSKPKLDASRTVSLPETEARQTARSLNHRSTASLSNSARLRSESIQARLARIRAKRESNRARLSDLTTKRSAAAPIDRSQQQQPSASDEIAPSTQADGPALADPAAANLPSFSGTVMRPGSVLTSPHSVTPLSPAARPSLASPTANPTANYASVSSAQTAEVEGQRLSEGQHLSEIPPEPALAAPLRSVEPANSTNPGAIGSPSAVSAMHQGQNSSRPEGLPRLTPPAENLGLSAESNRRTHGIVATAPTPASQETAIAAMDSIPSVSSVPNHVTGSAQNAPEFAPAPALESRSTISHQGGGGEITVDPNSEQSEPGKHNRTAVDATAAADTPSLAETTATTEPAEQNLAPETVAVEVDPAPLPFPGLSSHPQPSQPATHGSNAATNAQPDEGRANEASALSTEAVGVAPALHLPETDSPGAVAPSTAAPAEPADFADSGQLLLDAEMPPSGHLPVEAERAPDQPGEEPSAVSSGTMPALTGVSTTANPEAIAGDTILPESDLCLGDRPAGIQPDELTARQSGVEADLRLEAEAVLRSKFKPCAQAMKPFAPLTFLAAHRGMPGPAPAAAVR